MTDQVGAMVWDRVARPFGETHALTGTAANPQRFPGQYLDPETGYHYNYFRDYDPTTGRYMQSDPIGLAGGLNTTAYVGGNPVAYIDPEGLDRKRREKYEKPHNPNRRKGAENRQKSGERERNTRPKGEGEEHSRRPKGGFNPKRFPRLGPPIFIPESVICADPVLAPILCQSYYEPISFHQGPKFLDYQSRNNACVRIDYD